MTQPIKRKRNETTTITTTKSLNTIDKRMSQLSMSQPLQKKQKMTSNQVDQNEQATVTTSRSQLSKSKNKQQQFNDKDYIPDYLKVSNRIFKQMLISSFEGANKLVKRLNTSERINFVRQYAYLIHKRFYIELQQDQWKYYYDTGINTNIWSGRVSYRWAAMNSMYHTYGRSKKLIEQRLKTIARQYQEALQQLEQHANQQLPQCMSEMNPPFDFQSMLTMVIALVRKGQHKLKQQYEHNKKMLIFDSTDHRLVQTVYDYKPNTQQIRSFRNRWKAIYNKKQMEEQIEILKHRIHSNCLPPAFNLLDFSLDKIDKILTRSRSSTNNVDNDNNQRTTLCARRLKKIGRFKYDMLELSIAAGEEKVRYWDKIAKNAKKKLIAITARLNKNGLLSDISKQFMTAIEAREKHMIERADYITQQKMKSFFDEAPASQNDTTMDNDGVGANQNH